MEIAILDSNVLSAMGLKQLLERIVPMFEISIFRDFDSLSACSPGRFVHFFVSSGIYFEHAQFFLSQSHRSIVLVHGDNYSRVAGLLTLNVCQDEKSMLKSLLSLHGRGHSEGHPAKKMCTSQPVLTNREVEVAVLLVKGYINKEIADRLNVSLTTIISHRKNIMEKLHARSLADVMIYVVTHGIVQLGEI